MSKSSGKLKSIASRSAVIYQEIGESLVKSSLTSITEFNRFMIGTCFGAVPIFIGLLKLATPAGETLSPKGLWAAIGVVVVFLFGSLMAILGYMPISDIIGLQEPDSVKLAVNEAINFRRCMAWTAIVTLILGVIGACFVVLQCAQP